MAEQRTKQLARKERYTYQWYLPSEGLDRPQIKLETANPDGFIDAPAVGDSMFSKQGAAERESIMEEPAETQVLPQQTPTGIYRPKHRSLERTSSLKMLSFGGKMRIRILATAGWSSMVGVGAAALLTRAGPFPGTQVAELGAVWAGITAFLWIAVPKLPK